MKRRPLVLIVDDDRDIREMFTAGLRMAGFDVAVAADGIIALQQIDQRRPDAIVLDLDLPAVNGLAVHEELQARGDTHDLPVIILTGTEWDAPSRAFAILRKPVGPDDLIPVLRRALV